MHFSIAHKVCTTPKYPTVAMESPRYQPAEIDTSQQTHTWCKELSTICWIHANAKGPTSKRLSCHSILSISASIRNLPTQSTIYLRPHLALNRVIYQENKRSTLTDHILAHQQLWLSLCRINSCADKNVINRVRRYSRIDSWCLTDMRWLCEFNTNSHSSIT